MEQNDLVDDIKEISAENQRLAKKYFEEKINIVETKEGITKRLYKSCISISSQNKLLGTIEFGWNENKAYVKQFKWGRFLSNEEQFLKELNSLSNLNP